MKKKVNLQTLLHKTFTNVELINGYSNGPDEGVVFESRQYKYTLEHEPDCCEDVHLEDFVGDLFDLVGNPIMEVSERKGEITYKSDNPDKHQNSLCNNGMYNNDMLQYVFYRVSTIRGTVVFRFYTASNGMYSTEASLFEHK